MADTPDTIVLARHRELHSRGFNRPVRYAILFAFLSSFIKKSGS